MSPNTYKLKHVAWWFDNSGNLLGWGVFHDVIQLGADGNSFTGTEHIYLYDTNGILLGEQDGDVLKATRIAVDFEAASSERMELTDQLWTGTNSVVPNRN